MLPSINQWPKESIFEELDGDRSPGCIDALIIPVEGTNFPRLNTYPNIHIHIYIHIYTYIYTYIYIYTYTYMYMYVHLWNTI